MFGLSLLLSGSLWVAAAASVVAVVVAKAMNRRVVATHTNDGSVVATEHAPHLLGGGSGRAS